jgi:transmembrane sensor
MTSELHRFPIDLELLVRYLAGDATPPEVQAVERWLEADSQHAETLSALREVLGAGPQLVPQPDTDAGWRALESRLTLSAPPVTLVREWPLASRGRAWRPAVAAALAFVVAGSAGAWWYISSRHKAQTVEASAPVVSTPRGQRLSLRLSDGTLVTLAPGSTLRLSSTYGAGDRRVRLDGEAAFTVTHDTTRPFVVATAQAEMRDLGTRFVVRAYADERAEHVAVAEGRVAVRAGRAGEALVLERSDVARVSREGEVKRVPGAVLESYFAWTQGRLVFRDTSLRDAAAQLGRWYDIDIRFGASGLESLPLTASFADQPADEALRLVAAILDLELSQAGRVYTLRPR